MVSPDQCSHREVSAQGLCHTCGAKFQLFWNDQRSALAVPIRRNLGALIVVAALAVVMVATDVSSRFLTGALVAFAVFFLTRAIFSTMDMFFSRIFFNGTLGRMVPRQTWNPLSVKEGFAIIGGYKWPMDYATYELMEPGQRILVEHMRWSRLPVALYRIEST